MKKTMATLTSWNKETFGDIFKQLIIREEIIRLKEDLFEGNPSAANRMILLKA